jgi:hypothetical protein
MLNRKHPAYNRPHASITDEEIQHWSPREWEEYREWRLIVVLKRMVDEGMIEIIGRDKNGDPIYNLAPEPIQDEEVNNLIASIEEE